MRGGPMRGGPMRRGARWRAPRRPPGRAHTTAARLPPAISPPPPLHALTCLVHMVAHHGSTYLQAPQVSVHPVRRGAAACRAPHHAPSSGLLSVNGTSACAAFAICLCPRRSPLPGAGDRRTDLMVPDAPRARARGSRGRQRIRVCSNIICVPTALLIWPPRRGIKLLEGAPSGEKSEQNRSRGPRADLRLATKL
jgi:hypothetical protein